MHKQHGWGELRAFGGTHQSVAEALGGFQGVCVSLSVYVCLCVWKNRAVYQPKGEARGPCPALSSLPTMTIATGNNSRGG